MAGSGPGRAETDQRLFEAEGGFVPPRFPSPARGSRAQGTEQTSKALTNCTRQRRNGNGERIALDELATPVDNSLT
jgi:hypothetical protein